MILRISLKFLVLGCLLFLASCIKQEDFKNFKLNSTYDPSFSIPIVNSTLRVADAVAKADTQNVYLNSEGYYTIVYKDTVFTRSANDLISFPNQSFSTSLPATGAPVANLPSGSTLSTTTNGGYSLVLFNGMTLNYAELSAGNLQFSFTSTFKQDITIVFTFSTVVKNNVALSKSYNLTYNGTSPVSVTDNIDLSGYTISSSGGTNNIPYTVRFDLNGKGNPVLASERLNISADLSNLKYKTWVGNAGEFTIPLPEGSVQLGVFNQAIPVSDIKLVKPSLTLSLINSFGIPSYFKISKLYSTTAYEPTNFRPITTTAFVPLVSNGLNWSGERLIGYAPFSTVSNPTPTSVSTTFDIDNTNSNITDVVSPAPKFLTYETSLKVKGDGNTNFIRSDSKFSVFSKIELPLYGYISVYGLADTFNISLPDKGNVTAATIRLFTDNSIPIKLNLQAYFLDSLGKTVDSLVTNSTTTVAGFNTSGAVVAQPAIYDANGNLIASQTEFKDFVYDSPRYTKIYNCKKMILKGDMISSKVSTPPQNYNFKITPKMTMTFKLSMKVDLSLKP